MKKAGVTHSWVAIIHIFFNEIKYEKKILKKGLMFHCVYLKTNFSSYQKYVTDLNTM